MIKCVFNIILMMWDSCCCTSNRELVAIRKKEEKKKRDDRPAVFDPFVRKNEGQSEVFFFFFCCLYTNECRLETATTQSVCQSSSSAFVLRLNWNDEDRMIHVCVCFLALLIPIWNLIPSERRVIWWRYTKKEDEHSLQWQMFDSYLLQNSMIFDTRR